MTGKLACALGSGLLLSVCLAPGISARESLKPTSCRSSRFSLLLGPEVSEKTGQHTITLRLVNRGPAVCALRGFPKVTAYDRRGVIPFSINHRGDQMISPYRPTRVLSRPGQAVFVLLNHYRCDLGNVRSATLVRIGLPRVDRAVTASIKLRGPSRALDYCGRGDPGSTLTVSPFEPTIVAALRR